MRDFTVVAPSNLNGYIFESRAVRTLLELAETAKVDVSSVVIGVDIKPRFTDKEGIKYWREGDIHDYINDTENEFQGWEDENAS